MPFDGTGLAQGFIVEKIDRMIELIGSEDRWCKGILRSSDGRRCIAGAALEVEALPLVKGALLLAIKETTGKKYRTIELFNDAAETTHAQVLNVLHRARADVILGRTVATEVSYRERTVASIRRRFMGIQSAANRAKQLLRGI